jgi:hypothetical protein
MARNHNRAPAQKRLAGLKAKETLEAGRRLLANLMETRKPPRSAKTGAKNT